MAERKPLVTIDGVLQELPAADSIAGLVPVGGGAGQVLSKASAADRDLAWSTPAAGAVDNGLCLMVSKGNFLP